MEKLRQWFKEKPFESLFWLVLAAGAILRLYDFSAWSLSNDELSALNRLRFNSVREVIQYGIRPDGHPAFTQLLLYFWTMVFGLNPFWVRLPFVLAGIASIWLVWRVGKEWFHEPAGLFSALFLAVLPYPILYSHLARPYSFGLLFTLLTALFWGRYFLLKQNQPGILAGFALSAVLGMYTHYFSFMMSGLFILAGFLFITRQNWKSYLISLGAILLMYLPYTGIFLHQLSLGGVGGEQGWLDKPHWDWIFDFIYFALGSSAFHLILLLSFVVVFLLWIYSKELRITRMQWLSLGLFFLPFIVGFVYSVKINPVLQYSVMLFAFPFLLLFFFSFFEKIKPVAGIILTLAGIVGGSWVALEAATPYRNAQFADFKGCAKTYMEWENKYGADSIFLSSAINHPYYLEYYFTNAHRKSPSIFVLESKNGQELADLASTLRSCKLPYFAYIRLKPAPVVIPDVIRETYPVILDHKDFAGQAEAWLFARDTSLKGLALPQPVSRFFCDFEQADEKFGVNAANLDTIAYAGKYSLKMTPEMEWGPGIKIETGEAELRFPSRVKVKVRAMADSTLTDTPVIITITDRFGKQYVWFSGKLEHYLIPGQWGTAFLTADLPHPSSINDELKVFIWNHDHRNLWIDDFSIEFYKR
ncbi:MAG: glycosyltransferase family 39 protein [Bacteroidales bacterium]|nr:glycosyltransferase family 39 protein [Bacteroidales bacterium]